MTLVKQGMDTKQLHQDKAILDMLKERTDMMKMKFLQDQIIEEESVSDIAESIKNLEKSNLIKQPIYTNHPRFSF